MERIKFETLAELQETYPVGSVIHEEIFGKELTVLLAVCFVFLTKLGVDCCESVCKGVGVV